MHAVRQRPVFGSLPNSRAIDCSVEMQIAPLGTECTVLPKEVCKMTTLVVLISSRPPARTLLLVHECIARLVLVLRAIVVDVDVASKRLAGNLENQGAVNERLVEVVQQLLVRGNKTRRLAGLVAFVR